MTGRRYAGPAVVMACSRTRGLNSWALQAVQIEHTRALPGLPAGRTH